MTQDEAKNYKLPFGQFKGTTLGELDLTYLRWLHRSGYGDKLTKEALRAFITDEILHTLNSYPHCNCHLSVLFETKGE